MRRVIIAEWCSVAGIPYDVRRQDGTSFVKASHPMNADMDAVKEE